MGRSCINLVGNTTQGQNLGTGTTVFAGKSTSNTLSFKTLSALGDGISITCDSDNIFLSGTTGGSGGESYTFNNGLTETGGVVSLGGDLTGNTVVNLKGNPLIYCLNDGSTCLCITDSWIIQSISGSSRCGGYNNFNTNFQIYSCDVGNNCGSYLDASTNSMHICYNDGGNFTTIQLDQNGIRIKDDNLGMVYDADYSASGGTNPRWIPDAAWVTGQTGGGSGTTYTFTTGLTETSNVVSIDTGSIVSFGDSFIYWEFHNSSFDNYASMRLDHQNTLRIDRDVPTQESAISMSDSDMRLTSGLGSETNTIVIDENRINVIASGGTLGMTYNSDYSVSGSTNPRWIPDNAYVTGLTTPAGSDGQLQYNNAGTWGGTNLCYDDSTNTYGIGMIPNSGTTFSICDIRPYNEIHPVLNFIDGGNNNTFCVTHGSGASNLYVTCVWGSSFGNPNTSLYLNSGVNGVSTTIGGLLIRDNILCYDNNTSPNNCIIIDPIGVNANSCAVIGTAFNICGRSDFPSTPVEGTMVRLSGHATCLDGYYVYNGTAWQTLSTW